MSSITKNSIKILLGGIILSFIILFLFFYIRTSPSIGTEIYKIIPNLINSLILNHALIKSLNYLPVIIIFIYSISFSFLFTTRQFVEENFKFFDLATPAFTILVIFLLINASSLLIINPYLYRKNELIKYDASTSYAAYKRAVELKKKRNYDDALEILDIIFNLDPSNRKASKLYDEIMREKARAGATIEEMKKRKRNLPVKPEIGYFEKGKLEYEKHNYYAALYYFERAIKLHRGNRELNELYNRCLKKVKTALGTLTEKERERKWLIKNKELGLKYMNNKDYYRAYYTFVKILKKYPQLEDVLLYKKLVEKKLSEIDFLPSELTKYSWLPGWKNVIFIDKTGFLNTIEKVILFNNTYYFFGITRYYPDRGYGKSGYEYFRYGKWIKDHIRLKNKKRYFEIPKKKKFLYLINPDIDPWYIVNGIPSSRLQNQLNIYEVFTISDKLIKLGFNIKPKLYWLADKFGLLFALYVVTLFISAVGWSKRSIHESFPMIRVIMFFASMPIVAYFTYMLAVDINKIIIYTHQYFYRYVLKVNILIYQIVVETVLAVGTTLYFLTQKNE